MLEQVKSYLEDTLSRGSRIAATGHSGGTS